MSSVTGVVWPGPIFGAACGARPASSSGPPTTATSPTGPGTIRKGQTLDAVLHKGERHAYPIALQPGEAVTFFVDGESGLNTAGRGCGNWFYAFSQPSGAEMTSNPLGLAPNEDGTGPRPSGPIALAAKVPESGDMVAFGGTWTFTVGADDANCDEIRYRVRAE